MTKFFFVLDFFFVLVAVTNFFTFFNILNAIEFNLFFKWCQE
ncbi:hypothetical protein [Streptococcus sp. DD10]|nr:hypothetical protein [Streptococcus sp. DD10]